MSVQQTSERSEAGMGVDLQDIGELTTGQRGRVLAFTSASGFELAVSWPRAASALGAFLRRLGASPELAQDLVQDVAVRYLCSDFAACDDEELLRWSYVVARRLYIDHVRKQQPLPCDTLAMSDTPSPQDVPREVEGRLELSRVAKALRTMSSADQSTLLDVVEGHETRVMSRTEGTRLAVRRHRARSRLHSILAAAIALVFGCGRAFQRVARQVPIAAALITPLLVIMTGGLPLPTPDRGGPTLPAVVEVHDTAAHAVRAAAAEPKRLGRRTLSPSIAKGPAGRPGSTTITVPVPGTPVRARSGTSANPHHVLACVGIGMGLPDTCIPRPTKPAPLTA